MAFGAGSFANMEDVFDFFQQKYTENHFPRPR